MAGPGMMFLSAVIFGYFGFTTSWNYQGLNGQFLLFVALLDWTLKGSCLGYLVSGLLTLARPYPGNVLYAAVGLAGTVLFVLVAVLDIIDTQHTALHPFVVLLFAAWNGYASWSGLAELRRPAG
jgi:hypothetical protein